MLLDAEAPVLIEAVISADDKQAAVVEEGIAIQIAMPNAQLQIGDWLDNQGRIHFRKTLVESRYLGVNAERRPRQRREAHIIEKIRIRRAVERIIEVHVKKSIELEPSGRRVIAPGLETIPDAEAPDRPIID